MKKVLLILSIFSTGCTVTGRVSLQPNDTARPKDRLEQRVKAEMEFKHQF